MSGNSLRPLFCFVFVVVGSVWLSPSASSEEINGDELHVVVSANRYETPRDRTPSSVAVIDAATIEALKIKTVGEALKLAPSVDYVQGGGRTGNAAAFIRGANSEHTLVLIDGVEANSPISPTRSFNFLALTTDNIERIEILRGAQSVVYGSDAMGGVINIITKRPTADPHLTVSAEAGSYQSFSEQVFGGGGNETVRVNIGASRQDQGGISAADARDGNHEHDSFGESALQGSVLVTPYDTIEIANTSRLFDATSELDDGGGRGFDDPDRQLLNRQIFSRTTVSGRFMNEAIRPQVGFSISDQRYDDEDEPDVLTPDSLSSSFESRLMKFDAQATLDPVSWARLLLGAETEHEEGSSFTALDGPYGPYQEEFPEEHARSHGYFGQVEFNPIDDLTFVAGVRLDHHEEFNDQVTWRVGPSFTIPSTASRIFGTVATGFKAPSLYQRYSQYGREDLEPEESLSVDGGVEQELVAGLVKVSAAYFYNSFDNLISFEPNTFLFENIRDATTRGMEFSVAISPADEVDLQLQYSYTDSEDGDTGEALLRRARHKGSFIGSWKIDSALTLSSSIVWSGARWDNDFSTFPAQRVELGSYALLNLALSYQATKHCEFYARAENIFDREYAQVLGYGEPGAAVYGGVKLSL